MSARCEAAGRPNSKNEDNFQLGNDLSNGKWCFVGDEIISLNEKGALLVVCDGMGGMNAGEKASEIAVNTVKTLFEPEQISHDIICSPDAVRRHIEKAIIAADAKIKEEARADKAKEGMGSTIVMAWIIGENVYVGWCGDSRAYRFNPVSGLEQLSHDHSYVQELVDAGKLTPDLAFDHPSNNIITRSLGDPRQKAKPDVKSFPLNNGDVILLCSDGLCGVLRNAEIETIVAAHTASMNECLNALWYGARDAGWHDNVTIALCQILSGAKTPNSEDRNMEVQKSGTEKSKTNNWLLIAFIAIVMLSAGLLAGYFLFNSSEKSMDRITDLKGKIEKSLEKYPRTENANIQEGRSKLEKWTGELNNKELPDSCFKQIDQEYREFEWAKLDSLYAVRQAELSKKRNDILSKNPQDSIIKRIDTTVFFSIKDATIIMSIQSSNSITTGTNISKEQKDLNRIKEKMHVIVSVFDSGDNNKEYLKVQVDDCEYVVYHVPTGKGWTDVLHFARRCSIYPAATSGADETTVIDAFKKHVYSYMDNNTVQKRNPDSELQNKELLLIRVVKIQPVPTNN
jgi:serine/threonine protein phosphatase PrpC